jgi:hypothetical protein
VYASSLVSLNLGNKTGGRRKTGARLAACWAEQTVTLLE